MFLSAYYIVSDAKTIVFRCFPSEILQRQCSVRSVQRLYRPERVFSFEVTAFAGMIKGLFD